MATDVRPALKGYLKELARACHEDAARRAERETLSYERYPVKVISREYERRRKSRVRRL